MTDTLDLTFAELEFLLAEDPGWPDTRAALGIEPPPEGPAVVAAGLASLIVRGHVTTADQQIVLSEELSAALTVIALPTVWLDLALERPDAVLAGYVGLANGEPIVILSISAPGVFTVQAHESADESATAFGNMIATLITTGSKLLVKARSLPSDNVVLVTRSEDGSLAVGTGPERLTAATAGQVGDGAAILARAALAG